MRVRARDARGDMTFGRGQADFLVNTPQAVAQVVQTRMAMNLGEWFLDTSDGTPYRTQVLGRRTDATRDPAMRARILGTNGVTSIDTYASQLQRATRAYSVQVVINTRFGQALVASAQAAPNQDVRYAP